jgi:hypothetical protein
MNKLWKHTNFKWLSIISLISFGYIICSILSNSSILPKHATDTFNEIIIAIFSAAVLLLFFEIVQYCRDKDKFGYLSGIYVRKSIAQINEGGLRTDAIDIGVRQAMEASGNIKFIEGSKYHDLKFYDCSNTEYSILLNYEFGGNYYGYVEYYAHAVSGTNAHSLPKPKTKAEIALNLNTVDRITGTGSYKYEGKEDYGIYEFQVVGDNKDILVYYKNIFPSGLAEGYEIWVKKKA